MKKITSIMAITALVAICMVAQSLADDVYGRDKVQTTTSTGAGTYTNTADYAAMRLVRVACPAWACTDTITVTRVTGDTTYTLTNVVATITNSVSGGAVNFVDQDPNLPIYLKYGDKLTFSSAATTGRYVYVEYLLQRRD